jgi:serine/threonine protein kinase
MFEDELNEDQSDILAGVRMHNEKATLENGILRIRDKRVTVEDEFFDVDRKPFKTGGFGMLYKAKKKSTREIVVIKVFKQSVEREDFEKEISAISALKGENHPNVLRLLDAFEGSFKKIMSWMLVMEYIDGIDGKKLMDNMHIGLESLTFDQWQTMGWRMFSALSFLHEHDIAHRDIKPDNIMFRGDNPKEPVLIDFNLSCVKDLCTARDRSGTDGFFGPEIFTEFGNRKKDTLDILKASDVWAMSITLISIYMGGYPSWVFNDLDGKHTVALNEYDPPYNQVKAKWSLLFSDNRKEEIFAEYFFDNGLNLKWRKRWPAVDLKNLFAGRMTVS